MLHQLEFISFFIFSIAICFTKNANTISNERRINNRAQILKTTSFVIKNQRKLLRDSRTPMNFDNDELGFSEPTLNTFNSRLTFALINEKFSAAAYARTSLKNLYLPLPIHRREKFAFNLAFD